MKSPEWSWSRDSELKSEELIEAVPSVPEAGSLVATELSVDKPKASASALSYAESCWDSYSDLFVDQIVRRSDSTSEKWSSITESRR